VGTATPTSVSYCYDNLDRLINSSDAKYASPTYDSHGNTTKLGSVTLAYDGSDRHTKTVDPSRIVSYRHDASDRIIERTEVKTTGVRTPTKNSNGTGGTTLLNVLMWPPPGEPTKSPPMPLIPAIPVQLPPAPRPLPRRLQPPRSRSLWC